MFKIFITADVAKEAKEFLEKEFVVDIRPNMDEDELCKVISEYDDKKPDKNHKKCHSCRY